MLVCFERPVIMFACNTLCVSVPPPETSRHAVAWREVSVGGTETQRVSQADIMTHLSKQFNIIFCF